MKLIIALFGATCVAASQLFAQDIRDPADAYNAETMLKLCKGEVADMPQQLQSMTCTFRIQGVGDMMLYNCASREAGFSPAPVLSARISGSRGAIRQVFINYMESNPTMWGEHWPSAVAAALSESFPCEN